MKYRFAYALTGVIEGPSEEHARLQLLMAVSFNSRLAATGPEIAIRIEKVEDGGPDPRQNGGDDPRRVPRPLEH